MKIPALLTWVVLAAVPPVAWGAPEFAIVTIADGGAVLIRDAGKLALAEGVSLRKEDIVETGTESYRLRAMTHHCEIDDHGRDDGGGDDQGGDPPGGLLHGSAPSGRARTGRRLGGTIRAPADGRQGPDRRSLDVEPAPRAVRSAAGPPSRQVCSNMSDLRGYRSDSCTTDSRPPDSSHGRHRGRPDREAP